MLDTFFDFLRPFLRDTEINSMFRRQDTALVQFRRRGSDEEGRNFVRRNKDTIGITVEREDKNSPVTISTHFDTTPITYHHNWNGNTRGGSSDES